MEMIITAIAVVVLGMLSVLLKKLGKPITPPQVEEIPPVTETPEEIVPERPEVEIVPEGPKEETPPVVEEPKVEIEIPKTEEPKEEIKPEPEAPKVEEPKVEVVPETPKEEPKPTKPKSEKRNVKSNQIKVLVGDLRIRVEPMGEILGYADKNGYYTYTSTTKKNNITWYILENGSCIGDAGSGDLTVCKAGEYMIFPLKKYVWVSTKFSKDHTAVDFGWDRDYCTATQEIVAPYDMKVAKEGYDDVIGNYIYAHATYEGKKYTFRFIHLDSTSVGKGNSVKRGAVIGKMGNTGSSSGGHHLHFDILDGHRTTLPSDRYANSYDAMKMCYAPSNVVVDKETLADFTVLKA